MTDDERAPRSGSTPPVLRVVGADRYRDWDEIYRDNVVRLYRLLYSKVGNPDAEDLTAEVFVAAMPAMRTNASKAEIRANLGAAARTVLATYWRRRLGTEATALDVTTAVRFMDDPPPESDAPTRAAGYSSRYPTGTVVFSSSASSTV